MHDKIVAIEIVGCGVVVVFDDGWKMTIESQDAKEVLREAAMKILTMKTPIKEK